eukprot:9632465-Ditylum_brightwellii.AAC.1
MAFTYCVAQTCYDRIVVIMSAFLEQATGLAPEQFFFARTPKNLEYQLLTAYGPSKEKDYYSAQHLVHGVGQGPMDGLPKWMRMVKTALLCYDKKAKGANLKDPTGKISTQQNAKMFVEDNRQIYNNG